MWERNPRELFNPQENTPKSRNDQTTDTKIPSAICLQRNQKNQQTEEGRLRRRHEKKHTPLTKFSLSELRRLSWGMMGYYTKSCQSIKPMENPVRKTPKEWGWRWFCRTRESACWLAGWLAIKGDGSRIPIDTSKHSLLLQRAKIRTKNTRKAQWE